MERLIRFFVERHLLVNMITLGVIGIGVLSAMRIGVEGIPAILTRPASSHAERR